MWISCDAHLSDSCDIEKKLELLFNYVYYRWKCCMKVRVSKITTSVSEYLGGSLVGRQPDLLNKLDYVPLARPYGHSLIYPIDFV